MKKARAIRLLQKHWPLACGLIIGIMMCAALQSLWGVMFGVIGYWYFGSEFMNPVPQRVLTYEEYLEAVKRKDGGAFDLFDSSDIPSGMRNSVFSFSCADPFSYENRKSTCDPDEHGSMFSTTWSY